MADRVLLSQEEARALLALIPPQPDLSGSAASGLAVLGLVAKGKGAEVAAALTALGDALRSPGKRRVSTLVDETDPFTF